MAIQTISKFENKQRINKQQLYYQTTFKKSTEHEYSILYVSLYLIRNKGFDN